MENPSMGDTSSGYPYLAFFFFWTQGRIHFPAPPVVSQGYLTNFGQCVVCTSGKCHFVAKAMPMQLRLAPLPLPCQLKRLHFSNSIAIGQGRLLACRSLNYYMENMESKRVRKFPRS